MSPDILRRVTLACFFALIALGLAWEIFLAPVHPKGSLLALKVLPLVLALPAIAAGRVRAFQWWSMLILIYLAEGAVRTTSDVGRSVPLAALETALSAIAFVAIILYVRARRKAAA
ncbi:MAG: DUF2069 domain-containing protein [Gammaproteobacteria bacterium]